MRLKEKTLTYDKHPVLRLSGCIDRYGIKTYGVITEKAKRSKESRSACIGGYDYEIEYRNEFVCGSGQNGIYI